MLANFQLSNGVRIDERKTFESPTKLPPTPAAEADLPLHTINDIILARVLHPLDAPLVGYPQSSRGISDYVFYTAKDLDRFTNGVVKTLQDSGLERFSDPIENQVVAILGPSKLDYIVSLFALSTLGYAVLLLSTRLSTEAYIDLLAKPNCNHVLHSFAARKAVRLIEDTVSQVTTALIPKYSFYSQSCIANYRTSNSYRALLTLPLYHNHGLCTFFWSLFKAKPIAIYNASLPLTESFHGVPYVLKLLSEVSGGVEALAKCQQVLFGGSSCPDDLSDYLVDNGVRLISHYGAICTDAWNWTKLGQLMTSDRPVDDKFWSYVRPMKGSLPYLRMEELEDGSYECIALEGLPAKVSFNCDDPPNSFRTRDTFLKHPSLPNAWKYLDRNDDRVTLINGEKVFPVPIEHRIRQSKYMKDNLVFGVGKSIPGLLIVPSVVCQDMAYNEILDVISRETVIILPVGCEYPATHKGTMIRNRTYKQFDHLIETASQRLENGDSSAGEKLQLSAVDLDQYLLTLFRTELGHTDLGLSSEFFEAGVDSLQAIKARGIIRQQIDIGSTELGNNVIFDFVSIKKLAHHPSALRTGHQHWRCNSVKKVYCVVRATSSSNALDRVLQTWLQGLYPCLGFEDLGIPSLVLSELRTSLTKVIQSAWAANFTLGVRSFEAQHIKGIHNLVKLCLSSSRNTPAKLFYFCSSISAAAGTPLPATIAEAPTPELAHAQDMGYARSKSVAERTVQSAAEQTGMIVKVLKVDQIVGDTVTGNWNSTEAIPLMLQTAQTLKALPALDETPSWLPIDVVAEAILALTRLNDTPVSSTAALRRFSHDSKTVYHVQKAETFNWTEDLLPASIKVGLDFEILPKKRWVQRLREGEQDPMKNPAVKLLDFFVEKYDNDSMGRSGLVSAMEKSRAASPSFKRRGEAD
ncbi:hypothetical protein BJX70DRAFT_391121 [Aspergillus crustosus]